MGFPQGTRNNALFNLAVYAKKAYGDQWKTHVQEYNGKYMNPPLDGSEVMGVCKSVEKKEFTYTCKQAPICNYCNMPKCRALKYGIGMGDRGMPALGSLTKLLTEPPVWFLEVLGGGRLELSTDDLQSPRNFQLKCMSTLNIMPILPKAEDWQEMIHQLLENVTEVQIPPEATPRGQLWIHLEEFCTGRVQARTREELLLGKPWLYNGSYYFRLVDFMQYMERQKFKIALPNLSVYFREWAMTRQFFNIQGKACNTFVIAEKMFAKQDGEFSTPEMTNPDEVLS
jgi:hypothetical protein